MPLTAAIHTDGVPSTTLLLYWVIIAVQVTVSHQCLGAHSSTPTVKTKHVLTKLWQEAVTNILDAVAKK